MVWMDRVRSLAYQAAKVMASRTAKIGVVTVRDTPRLSVRLSLTSVPTTLISTTANQ
jgi:hypothetical protein